MYLHPNVIQLYKFFCNPYVFLGVLLHCIQCLQPSMFWCPLLHKKKIFMLNLTPLVFQTFLFGTLVIICYHFFLFLIIIPIFLLFSICHHPLVLSKCVSVVLHVNIIPKPKHCINFWIFNEDVWIWERVNILS